MRAVTNEYGVAMIVLNMNKDCCVYLKVTCIIIQTLHKLYPQINMVAAVGCEINFKEK